MLRFRSGDLTAAQVAEELKIGRRRFYQLYLAFLKAVGRRQADHWSPGTSGGDHRHPWPEGCQALLEKLLRAKVSYSAAALASQRHCRPARGQCLAGPVAPPSQRHGKASRTGFDADSGLEPGQERKTVGIAACAPVPVVALCF